MIKLDIICEKQSSIDMILVNTNKSRNSKALIESVMKLKESDINKFNDTIRQIGNITDEIIE